MDSARRNELGFNHREDHCGTEDIRGIVRLPTNLIRGVLAALRRTVVARMLAGGWEEKK